MPDRIAYSDEDLLRKIKSSDQGAFNSLFERYQNRLFVYLFKIIKSKETAEEIVLDVFLKIWVGRSILAEINNFEAFLFCVAKNKALDFLRYTQKSKLQQMELWNQMQEMLSSENADQHILLEETKVAIQDAVSLLSPQRKMVFQLSREYGLTYEQIAERLHLSKNTVRNHLAASLQFIRGHLAANNQMMLFFF
jgi:RNA polymerase sigma-70 factor (ECF subfamily)